MIDKLFFIFNIYIIYLINNATFMFLFYFVLLKLASEEGSKNRLLGDEAAENRKC